MAKIIGAGSLIVDITGYAAHLPVPGETSRGQRLVFGPGGKGSNQMTAASRAGAEAIIISRMGRDFLSSILAAHYEREGMITRYIRSCDTETGSALIEVDTVTAQNRIIVVSGACECITAQDVLEAERDFADADAVITQLETSIESVRACKELAQKYGKPFILNPAPYREIPDDLLRGVDYLTPNETEAEYFSGIPVTDSVSAERAARALLDRGVRNVIITLGKQGAFYCGEQGSILLPAISVDAVDTTGAGDAFNGGFAAAIAFGADVWTALRFANCTGALSVTRTGTAPAMPMRCEIDALMQQQYGCTL